MPPPAPRHLGLLEALLLSLALATAALGVEIASLVTTLPTYGAVVRHTNFAWRAWLDTAAVIGAFGLAGALAARLAPRSRRRGLALALVLLAPAAVALLHASTRGSPALRRALGPEAPTPALAGVLVVLAALALAALLGGRRLRRGALVGLLAAVLALFAGVHWMAALPARHRSAASGHATLAVLGVAILLLAAGLLRAERRRAPLSLAASLAGCVALLVASLWLPAPQEPGLMGAGGGAAAAPTRPPVLLIVADTLRADFVSAVGGAHGTTPHLDALAADGIAFTNVRAAAPWTTPSFASLFTSTYPGEHAAGQRVSPERLRRRPLGPRLTTLAEALSRSGYLTAGVVSNAFLGPSFKLDRGFRSYEDIGRLKSYHLAPAWLRGVLLQWLRPSYTRAYARGDRETERIRDRLAALRASGRPWFLLAHYMDTHRPYQVDSRFLGDETGPARTAPYRGAVRSLDEWVGLLLADLRAAGDYDDALIVFTADHGEELTEERLAGDYDHGHTLYAELLRVPLIVKLPGGRLGGTRRDELVSLIDVGPTVLGALGIRLPPSFRGVDLLSEPPGPAPDRTIFAETLLQVPEQKAALRGDLKVILRSLPPRLDAAAGFDRAADPGERSPLPVAGDPRFEPLYRDLVRHVAENRRTRPREKVPALDPALRRDLEALGYAR
jgi:arylsulfatase A-like enzyme